MPKKLIANLHLGARLLGIWLTGACVAAANRGRGENPDRNDRGGGAEDEPAPATACGIGPVLNATPEVEKDGPPTGQNPRMGVKKTREANGVPTRGSSVDGAGAEPRTMRGAFFQRWGRPLLRQCARRPPVSPGFPRAQARHLGRGCGAPTLEAKNRGDEGPRPSARGEPQRFLPTTASPGLAPSAFHALQGCADCGAPVQEAGDFVALQDAAYRGALVQEAGALVALQDAIDRRAPGCRRPSCSRMPLTVPLRCNKATPSSLSRMLLVALLVSSRAQRAPQQRPRDQPDVRQEPRREASPRRASTCWEHLQLHHPIVFERKALLMGVHHWCKVEKRAPSLLMIIIQSCLEKLQSASKWVAVSGAAQQSEQNGLCGMPSIARLSGAALVDHMSALSSDRTAPSNWHRYADLAV
ncbi:hypothetical protein TRIUR3_23677 [Triticum urartu]|uniref:Uncharacterized protein n=1 Tax=Triticum urartu TaxID=4572 RepID=M7YUN1_TRIUA|nr:hypothetical protein TRIUR3_23677 [Triticum urartu]